MLFLVLLLVSTSCASKRFNTTLDSLDFPRNCSGVRFRIESVDPLDPNEFFITGYTDSDYWFGKVKGSGHMDKLAADLQEKVCALYPDIFNSESSSLPLQVSVATRSYRNTSVASSFLAALTWGLFGIVLPLPLEFSCDYQVIVSCPEAGIIRETGFANRLSSWISFPSPLALIPVPGHADQRACVIYPYQSKHYIGRHFMLECFSRAIVKSLFSVDCETFLMAAANRKQVLPGSEN